MPNLQTADIQTRVTALESRIAQLEAAIRGSQPGSGAEVVSGLRGAVLAAPADLDSRAMKRERGIVELLESFRHPPFYRALLDAVSERIGKDLYLAWFVGTRLESDEGGEVTISAGDALQADWLGKTYTPVVEDALAEIGRPKTVARFVVRADRPVA